MGSGAGRWEAKKNLGKKYKIYWIAKKREEINTNILAEVLGNWVEIALTVALLFWFFGDFRCGALLFMVIHVIYKYKNR